MEKTVMDIRLYETNDITKVVCQLVEKIYGQDKRIQIICPNQLMVVSLDQALWQFKQLSFLPHMTDLDHVDPATQPIFITSNSEANLNQADVILSCNVVPKKMNCESLIGICNSEVCPQFMAMYQPNQYFIQTEEGWQAGPR
jgi:DNA polymerase IIIc chi subunit